MKTPVKRGTQVPKQSAPTVAESQKPLPAPMVQKTSLIRFTVPADATDAVAGAVLAETLTRPETNAAAVIDAWQKDTHDVNAVADELRRQVQTVNDGDLSRAEGLLIAQAHALDNIFANLARRATNQTQLLQWETYMRMAMKAQNQCRMTLESLGTIKNPPAVFARQANINNGGNQQVNNGPAANAPPAPAEETPLCESKLLAPPAAAQTTGLFSKPHRTKSVREPSARSGHGKR